MLCALILFESKKTKIILCAKQLYACDARATTKLD